VGRLSAWGGAWRRVSWCGVSLVVCFLLFLLGVLSHRLGPLTCTGGRRCARSRLFLPRLNLHPCLFFFHSCHASLAPASACGMKVCVPAGRPSPSYRNAESGRHFARGAHCSWHLRSSPLRRRRPCQRPRRLVAATVGVEFVHPRADDARVAVLTLAVGRVVRSWCRATTVVLPSITLAAVRTVGQVPTPCTSSPPRTSSPTLQWTGDGA